MSSQVDIHLRLTPSPADDVDDLVCNLVRRKRWKSVVVETEVSRPEVPSRRGSADRRLLFLPTCVVPRRRGQVQKLKTTGTISSSIRNLPIVMNFRQYHVHDYPYRDEGAFLNFGGLNLSSFTVIGYTKMGSK